jgi:uncharacterized protein YraI
MRSKIIVAALTIAAFAFPGIASAQNAFTSEDANIHAGPDPAFPVISMIPEGQPIDIHGCVSGYEWCDVTWEGRRGWVDAEYLVGTYNDRRVSVFRYGRQIDVPILGFAIDDYWNRFYREEPWYGNRERWHLRFGNREWDERGRGAFRRDGRAEPREMDRRSYGRVREEGDTRDRNNRDRRDRMDRRDRDTRENSDRDREYGRRDDDRFGNRDGHQRSDQDRDHNRYGRDRDGENNRSENRDNRSENRDRKRDENGERGENPGQSRERLGSSGLGGAGENAVSPSNPDPNNRLNSERSNSTRGNNGVATGPASGREAGNDVSPSPRTGPGR